MSFTVLILSYGGVESDTVSSLYRDLPLFKETVIMQGDLRDAAVHRIRARSATQFMETQSDVLVQIDHDIAWDIGDIEHLVKRARETHGVVAGLVSTKDFGKGVASRMPEGRYEIGTNEMVPMPEGAYIGGAFIAYHRDAFMKVFEHHKLPVTLGGYIPFFTPRIIYNEKMEIHEELTEDWAFSLLAQEAGVPCHITMKPVLGHRGKCMFTAVDAQRGIEVAQVRSGEQVL